jgi:hypothetical protein
MNIDKQVIVILAPMIQREFDLDLVTITQILDRVGKSIAWPADRRRHLEPINKIAATFTARDIYCARTPRELPRWAGGMIE